MAGVRINIDTSNVEVSRYSDELLGELMLYVASRCSEHPKFGAIKLNKILFYADFLSFQQEGKSITGATYMKLEHGPAPRRFLPVQQGLIEDRAAAIQEKVLLRGNVQKRLVALRPPRLELFSGSQIERVHRIIDAFEHATAEEISLFSHGKIWQAAEDKEEIPYEAVFISDADLTPSDVERGESLAREYEWNA